jgi:hypothetical protein
MNYYQQIDTALATLGEDDFSSMEPVLMNSVSNSKKLVSTLVTNQSSRPKTLPVTTDAESNNDERNSSFLRQILATIFLLLAILCGYYTLPNTQSVAVPSGTTQVKKQLVTKNIEEIQCGDRVLGKNPVLSEEDRKLFGQEPTKASHYEYIFALPKEDETLTFVTLLRPCDWLEQNDLVQEFEVETNPGETVNGICVWLELPEMGTVGWAQLLAVNDEFEIKSGQGNIVTGTFTHLADNIIDLKIEDQKPIGCTDNHPFWSVDRQDYIPAGNLQNGERILLYSGETKRVEQKLPRPGPEVVYNIEVFGEHVYYVGENGTLVHNSCHPNSTASKLVNYGYAIIDTATGAIQKFGITMSAIGKNGLPQRTTRQLREGETGVLLGTFKNRADALKWEKYVVKMFGKNGLGKHLHEPLPRNLLPKQ